MTSTYNVLFLIDDGTGKCRKFIDVSSTGLSLTGRPALASMHAFSGNDFVSRFFKRESSASGKK